MNELNGILEFSPLVLLSTALWCLGLWLKAINWHPDRLIPISLPIIGAVVWCLIGESMTVDWIKSVKHPNVVHALVGFIAGVASVWGDQVLRQINKKEP